MATISTSRTRSTSMELPEVDRLVPGQEQCARSPAGARDDCDVDPAGHTVAGRTVPGRTGSRTQAADPGPSGGNSTPADLSEKAKFYDSRQEPSAERVLQARAAESSASPKSGVAALRQELGDQAIVSIDPLTGTARSVSRLNGFLTPQIRAPPPPSC